MCVCFGIKMLIIFLLRDVFRRSKCCLDPWLSCMFDCIHICVFLFLKNCFKATSTTPWHLSIPGLSIELFSYFLSQSWHLSIARSIDRESLCPLNSSTIHRACFAVDTSEHLLNSCICRNLLKFNTFRHLLSVEIYWTPIYRVSAIRSSFSSIRLCPFTSQTSLTHSKPLPQGVFSLDQVILQLVSV